MSFLDVQSDAKPLRIYQIPLQTLSKPHNSSINQRRCQSPTELDVVDEQPSNDSNFLSINTHRLPSRSCSPTPNIAVSSASTPSK